ncbi:MAG: restriction endonuclease subunit S [Candidatus Firestonebacteria bacterium]|nr:restriction endonuclease subunit S [Candidatus Firestonebacteria bacterium]
MKKGWDVIKLIELCDVFADGDWIEKKDQSTNGIRLIQTGNIGNGLFLDRLSKSRYISKSTFTRLRCLEVLPGDCLLSRLPDPVGRSCIIPKTDEKMITAVDCTIMRFKKNILAEWFVNYSLSRDYQNKITEDVSGATRQRISRSNLGNVEIPIPTIIEQKRIVGILDKVFADIAKAKENAEKNLQNASELFESYLQNVFAHSGDGWEEKKLGDVCSTGAGGTPLKAKKEYYQGGTIPWLRSGEVSQGEIYESEMYITEKGLENSSARLFPSETVLIAMYGATAGQVGILKFKCSTNQAICGILPNINYIPSFIYYCFLSKKDELISQAVGGAQPNISQIKIKNTPIPVLSKKEQQNVVLKLDEISAKTKKLEAIYQKKLDDLEELKKSILQKAFNGEL